jgi:hypothetical protein
MFDSKRHSTALQRGAATLASVAAVALAAASPAAAAAGTQTLCGGWLSRAPTTEEPDLLNYQFHCDWGITAYTLVINRQPGNYNVIDDFSPTATALSTTGSPLTTVSFTCAGDIPGDGVSCNTGSSSSYLPAPDFAQGQFDPAEPYCAHVPKGSPSGTKPEPQALVQLIITDTNGAQNGPFRLNLSPGCAAAHNKAKSAPKHKKK